MMKFKKILNCFIFFICLIIIGFWWIGMTSIKPTVTVNLKNHNQTYEYGQEIKLSKDDFIKSIEISKNYIALARKDIYQSLNLELDIPNEDSKSYPAIGKYDGKINIKNNVKKKIDLHISKNKLNINVQDTTKPQLSLSQDTITFDFGTSITKENIDPLIQVKDLSPTQIEYDLASINTQKSGDYVLQITAKDTSNNTQSTSLKIKIKEKIIPVTENKKYNINTSNSSSIKNDIYILDGNVGQSYLKQALAEWNKIPSSVTQKLIASGWKFYLTAYEIQGLYYNGPVKGTIAGVTIYASKTIYIKARGTASKRAPIHEIGHAYDGYLGFVSYSQEFKDIFNQEKDSLKVYDKYDNHYKSSSAEFFAEAFRTYCYSPSALKNSAPRTYEFICRNL